MLDGDSTCHCGWREDVHINMCLVLMVTEIELIESVRSSLFSYALGFYL
jgi:hypothetical protein